MGCNIAPLHHREVERRSGRPRDCGQTREVIVDERAKIGFLLIPKTRR
jgi:hypothetical protein